MSGRVVILRQNFLGPGEAGFSRGEVGAEEQEIARFHFAGYPSQKREGIEVRQNPKQGKEPRGGRREVEGGKGT